MNDARPSKTELSAPVEGGPIISTGGFPSMLSSVSAEVLVRLLNRERLTSLDAVSDASTTRLSALVHYLGKFYGWQIESVDKAAPCSDGRVSWVSEYFLSAETVQRAMAAGAGEWCVKVRAARRAKRTKAAHARCEAARANAARQVKPARGQWGLFDG